MSRVKEELAPQDYQPDSVKAGIDMAYRYVRALFDAHTREFGIYDPSTNAWEFDGPSEEIDGLYQELVEGIENLKKRVKP